MRGEVNHFFLKLCEKKMYRKLFSNKILCVVEKMVTHNMMCVSLTTP